MAAGIVLGARPRVTVAETSEVPPALKRQQEIVKAVITSVDPSLAIGSDSCGPASLGIMACEVGAGNGNSGPGFLVQGKKWVEVDVFIYLTEREAGGHIWSSLEEFTAGSGGRPVPQPPVWYPPYRTKPEPLEIGVRGWLLNRTPRFRATVSWRPTVNDPTTHHPGGSAAVNFLCGNMVTTVTWTAASKGYPEQGIEKHAEEFNAERTRLGEELKPEAKALAEKLVQAYRDAFEREKLDIGACGSEPEPTVVTGRGTENEIEWDVKPKDAKVEPGDIPTSPATLDRLPDISDTPTGEPGRGIPGGKFVATWMLPAQGGLTLATVRYDQSKRSLPFPGGEQPTLNGGMHPLVEYLQWRNARLVFEDEGPDGRPVVRTEIPVDLRREDAEVLKVVGRGIRKWDQKQFAWALVATFRSTVTDPVDKERHYPLEITQEYLFSVPLNDQCPGAATLVLKVYPTLTVKIRSDPEEPPKPSPSFAADLKMVFAPRLTREDQHRQPSSLHPDTDFYGAAARRETNVVGLYCDTNTATRPLPGQGFFAPNVPFWSSIFDYAEPEISQELTVDAVVYPRERTNPTPFSVLWGPADQPGATLVCQREPGQGEYDNLHLQPYVGFADPLGAYNTRTQDHALVEAPLGGDEVVHMHWRWGAHLSKTGVTEAHARGIMGYAADLDDPKPWHKVPGAPLIPANQSLRLKIGRPGDDDGGDSGGPRPLDPKATAIWYNATVHRPKYGAPSQFFVHGFGLAYYVFPPTFTIAGVGPTVTQSNANLLDAPLTFAGTSYHEFRWAPLGPFVGRQRVPWVSRDMPRLSKNRIGVGVDEGNWQQ